MTAAAVPVPVLPGPGGVPVTDFADAMARLATGLAVVTARRADGKPCGLLVSSLCSWSVRPPSVLIAIDRAARSYPVLTDGDWFGVHLLGAGQDQLVDRFARRFDRKFDGVEWAWEGPVPRLAGSTVFLLCATSAVLAHGDHAAVIGEIRRTETRPGPPLVVYQRRRDWVIRPPALPTR